MHRNASPSAVLTLLLLFLLATCARATPSSTLHYERPDPAPKTPLAVDEVSIGPWHVFCDWYNRFFSTRQFHEEQSSRIINAPEPSSTSVPKGSYTSYHDHVVIRFNIKTIEEAEALREASDILFLDIWEAAEGNVDIRLAKDVLSSLLGLLPKSMQHPQKIAFPSGDLVTAISDTFPKSPKHPDLNNPFQARKSFSPRLNASQSNVFFNEYRPLSVMVPWMRLLQSLFSTHVRMVTVGRSWEGREIYGMRVGVHPTNDNQPLGPRKTILVTGGSHAREWISTSTVNYVMYSLVSAYGRSQDITELLQSVDFLFVPTMNPDGYVYSWEVDRLWRKTRQSTPIRFCRGIDMDRTWGFHWGADAESASANPCSESYAGDKPFASVEAASFSTWLKNETANNNVDFIGLLDLHSYSQSILLPYSFSCEEEPPALEDLEELGEGMSREIRRTYGEYYDVISACQGNVIPAKRKSDRVKLPSIQTAGGNPLDWFYHELGIRYSYQIKLRDMGSYGFLLPPEYIVPQGEEILRSVLYLSQSLAQPNIHDEQVEDTAAFMAADQKPLLAT